MFSFPLCIFECDLTEIYKVPSFDDVTLSNQVSDDSTDEELEVCVEHNVHKETEEKPHSTEEVANEDPEDSSSDSGEESGEEEASEGEVSDNDEHAEQRPADGGKPGSYTYDPVVAPPRNLTPATMERLQRVKKKPDRYGAWTS